MKRQLNFGMIGCGRMGRVHTERLQADGRGRVTALFDTHRPMADRLQHDLLPNAAVFDSLASMLDEADLDAAVICPPTTAHYDQVLACRERGLHLLCEKPLADTRNRMIDLIIAINFCVPLLSVGYQRRYWGTYRTVRREVQSGRWGDIRMITSHNVENWQQTIDGTWRDDPAINWGGFIGDAGSHKIDAVFYTTGLSAQSVWATTERFGSHVEVGGSVAARKEGGVLLNMDFVGNAQDLGEDFHIHCQHADLMIRDRKLWIAREGQIEPFPDVLPDSNPVVGFLDALVDGEPNLAPPECALPVYDLTQAILESSAKGRIAIIGD